MGHMSHALVHRTYGSKLVALGSLLMATVTQQACLLGDANNDERGRDTDEEVDGIPGSGPGSTTTTATGTATSAGDSLGTTTGATSAETGGGQDTGGVGTNADTQDDGVGDSDWDTPKFDLSVPDVGNDTCPGDQGYEFSVIWIANSPDGTVSKIDTKTATEIARYATGPERTSDPSRTSVNLLGAVAIANRSGSVTKIAAVEDHCIDRNGDGMITTSTGPDVVLPWGEDECVLWHHDIDFTPPMGSTDNKGGPRALAWEPGEADPDDPCQIPKPKLWVGWRDQPTTASIVRRIDADGMLDDEVRVEDFIGNWNHGVYGGASDAGGNFWGLGSRVSEDGTTPGSGTVLRVDASTLEVKRYQYPGESLIYGMALDAEGNPWVSGYEPSRLYSLDAATGEWTDHGLAPANAGQQTRRLRGMMIDADHRAWIATNEPCGLALFDTKLRNWVNGLIPLPGCQSPVGISIDSESFVWVVDQNAQVAYKVDPNDYSSETVGGLIGPYTYSDMTGAGLKLQVDPPE